jgi:S-adenosylmethionine hydrolase
MRRLTLLTDFGTADGYAAAMKGVVATICPDAVLEDASHDIPPGDIHAAAWALSRYWRLYPPGTVHIVVVDPGVGGERRALAVLADGRWLVAPDNGVLTRVLDEAPAWTAVAIQERRFLRQPVSRTFHGRDVFAPAAAHLAAGVAMAELGPPVTDPVRLPLPAFSITPAAVVGEVVHVDRFGNLVTNIPGSWAGSGPVRVGALDVGRLALSYSDVAPGEALALVGSAGVLEVSVRDGSAAALLGVGRGAEVSVRRE